MFLLAVRVRNKGASKNERCAGWGVETKLPLGCAVSWELKGDTVAAIRVDTEGQQKVSGQAGRGRGKAGGRDKSGFHFEGSAWEGGVGSGWGEGNELPTGWSFRDEEGLGT